MGLHQNFQNTDFYFLFQFWDTNFPIITVYIMLWSLIPNSIIISNSVCEIIVLVEVLIIMSL